MSDSIIIIGAGIAGLAAHDQDHEHDGPGHAQDAAWLGPFLHGWPVGGAGRGRAHGGYVGPARDPDDLQRWQTI